MKMKTWNSLYQVRQYLILAYIDEDNNKTKEDINKIIIQLSKLIDKK